MVLEFEWDPGKERENRKKHGISFEEAKTVFGDPLARTRPDPEHAMPGEERWVAVGQSYSGKLILVAYEDRNRKVRIISARRATARERKAYEAY
jgi:hypothetical protein